jgi:hypothetical protein
MTPETLTPMLDAVVQSAWRIVLLAAVLYFLVPILWMVAVPEARASVARLTRNVMIGLLIGLAASVALPFAMLGAGNPYLPSFLRAIALPALVLLAVSGVMTLITYWWAARTPPEESNE